MSSDKTKKQSIRIIVSEAIMVVSVIITVVILALLVSGYWLNSDFKVERNGMLQVYSTPTGANVEIDGQTASWLERTNSSKILSSGEHTIVLTKDGYDSWSKTIEISEGLLYRLHYPHLFPLKHTVQDVLEINDYSRSSISANYNTAILLNNTTKWAFVNLDTDKPATKTFDISKLFNSVSLADGADTGLFTGEILGLEWDADASHVLVKSRNSSDIEWVLLDVNHPDKSINLTKEFGANFSRIEILDNSSNNLLAIQNGNLHKIDVPGRLISAVLAKDVFDFDHYNNEVVFSAMDTLATNTPTANDATATPAITDSVSTTSIESPRYYVGLLKVGDSEVTRLNGYDAPIRVIIGKFYDDKYIAVVGEHSISIHNPEAFGENATTYDFSFSPDEATVGYDGEFILLAHGSQLAALDLEANRLREWTIESSNYGWLDRSMLYTVVDGNLIVYDFDGLNRRAIATNVSSHFPVTITSNKWLYYFSDNTLMRESL